MPCLPPPPLPPPAGITLIGALYKKGEINKTNTKCNNEINQIDHFVLFHFVPKRG